MYRFLGLLLVCFASVAEASNYQNSRVAVYARAYEVVQMNDPAWLEQRCTGGKSMAARVAVNKKFTKLVDVVTRQQIAGQATGERTVFDLTLEPATYRVLSAE